VIKRVYGINLILSTSKLNKTVINLIHTFAKGVEACGGKTSTTPRLHKSGDEASGEFLTNRISLFTHLGDEMCDDVMFYWLKTLRSSLLRFGGVSALHGPEEMMEQPVPASHRRNADIKLFHYYITHAICI
jgi:hypothetical protein